jgi:hypothetical protein
MCVTRAQNKNNLHISWRQQQSGFGMSATMQLATGAAVAPSTVQQAEQYCSIAQTSRLADAMPRFAKVLTLTPI